jgi:hypothetical protein
MTPSPWLVVFVVRGVVLPARRAAYVAGSKMALINTLKTRFICNGESSIDTPSRPLAETVHSR